MASVARLRTADGQSNEIGPRVRERIQALGLSNSLLCGRIAAETNGEWVPDRLDITNIIHGRRAVLTTELVVLARVLETTAAKLLGEI